MNAKVYVTTRSKHLTPRKTGTLAKYGGGNRLYLISNSEETHLWGIQGHSQQMPFTWSMPFRTSDAKVEVTIATRSSNWGNHGNKVNNNQILSLWDQHSLCRTQKILIYINIYAQNVGPQSRHSTKQTAVQGTEQPFSPKPRARES